MEKRVRELLDIMDILIEQHKKLIVNEEEKIEAIINQDWKSVEVLLRESESILAEINRSEKLREKIMKNLGYDLDTPLSELAESLPSDVYVDLKLSRERLIDAIEKLKSVNNRTKTLLEDSLEIINFTLGLISNGNKATKTYGLSGEEVTENKDTSSFVLDFKA